MSLFQTFTNLIIHIVQRAKTKNLAIYVQDGNTEALTNALIFDGSAVVDKKTMEHPKENGAVITDHIIDDPSKCNIKLLIYDDDAATLNELMEYYRKSTVLTVKIKNEIFSNLVINSKPLSADSEHYNATVYNLAFKEVQNAITQYVVMPQNQVKKPTNASRVKTGHKQAQPQPSILRKIYNKVAKK